MKTKVGAHTRQTGGMSVAERDKIGRKALRLMEAENRINTSWQREPVKYREEVKQMLKREHIEKLPSIYYSIFEDANYHSLNEVLQDLNVYLPPYQDDTEYKAYRNAGGRTWNL